MKELSIKEIRERFLDILVEIDRVCKKYDIEYFLDAGTLLGAVRHHGFIPWDDDVDIGMRRIEYNKFIEAWGKEEHNRFSLKYDGNTNNYLWGFAKIIDTETSIKEIEVNVPFEYGLFVDVFPYDDASYENEQDIEKDNEELLRIYRHYMINFFRYFIPRKKYASICNWYLCKDKNKNEYFRKDTSEIAKETTKYLTEYPKDRKIKITRNGVSYPPEAYNHYPRELFFGVQYVPFENHEFPIPVHHKEILTILYGDYMTPPPEKDRVGHHFLKAILK